MNVVIVEDEKLAEEYLHKLLQKSQPDTHVVAKLDSVKNAIKWFLKNPHPDLVFMDIDLGDGLCFEIFEVIDLQCPVIFTTAYDQYAIKAFKVNSIDYLLKPVDLAELNGALDKFRRLQPARAALQYVRAAGAMLSRGSKERFIIKIGDRIKTLAVTQILYFMSRSRMTYARSSDGRNYPIDYTLERIEELVSPVDYFRINRQYHVRFEAILDIVAHSNSRLKLRLQGSEDPEVIVARDRVADFKQWLDR